MHISLNLWDNMFSILKTIEVTPSMNLSHYVSSLMDVNILSSMVLFQLNLTALMARYILIQGGIGVFPFSFFCHFCSWFTYADILYKHTIVNILLRKAINLHEVIKDPSFTIICALNRSY